MRRKDGEARQDGQSRPECATVKELRIRQLFGAPRTDETPVVTLDPDLLKGDDIPVSLGQALGDVADTQLARLGDVGETPDVEGEDFESGGWRGG